MYTKKREEKGLVMCKGNQKVPTITILEENVQIDMKSPINHISNDAYLVAFDEI